MVNEDTSLSKNQKKRKYDLVAQKIFDTQKEEDLKEINEEKENIIQQIKNDPDYKNNRQIPREILSRIEKNDIDSVDSEINKLKKLNIGPKGDQLIKKLNEYKATEKFYKDEKNKLSAKEKSKSKKLGDKLKYQSSSLLSKIRLATSAKDQREYNKLKNKSNNNLTNAEKELKALLKNNKSENPDKIAEIKIKNLETQKKQFVNNPEKKEELEELEKKINRIKQKSNYLQLAASPLILPFQVAEDFSSKFGISSFKKNRRKKEKEINKKLQFELKETIDKNKNASAIINDLKTNNEELKRIKREIDQTRLLTTEDEEKYEKLKTKLETGESLYDNNQKRLVNLQKKKLEENFKRKLLLRKQIAIEKAYNRMKEQQQPISGPQKGGHKKFKNNTLKKKINFQKRSHKIYQYREPNKQSKKHKLHKLHTKSEKKTKKVYL